MGFFWGNPPVCGDKQDQWGAFPFFLLGGSPKSPRLGPKKIWFPGKQGGKKRGGFKIPNCGVTPLPQKKHWLGAPLQPKLKMVEKLGLYPRYWDPRIFPNPVPNKWFKDPNGITSDLLIRSTSYWYLGKENYY